MKRLLLVATLLLALTNCRPADPEPADPLTQTRWCNGYTTYEFGSSGSFIMRGSKSGQIWGGNWYYGSDHTQIDINLSYGPNRLIQIIRLKSIHCTKSSLTAQWSDEIAHELPIEWQACTNE